MAISSTRSDITVEQRDDSATLTIFARNPVVSWIALVVGGFVSLGALLLAAYGVSVSNYLTVVVMAAAAVGVLWLTWHIGWRSRPFEIRFSRGFLESGQQRYAYADIVSYGLSSHGGDVVDPLSVGVPRNVTIGEHLYVEVGPRFLPITVALKDAQAKEALRLFGLLFDEYRSAPA